MPYICGCHCLFVRASTYIYSLCMRADDACIGDEAPAPYPTWHWPSLMQFISFHSLHVQVFVYLLLSVLWSMLLPSSSSMPPSAIRLFYVEHTPPCPPFFCNSYNSDYYLLTKALGENDIQLPKAKIYKILINDVIRQCRIILCLTIIK